MATFGNTTIGTSTGGYPLGYAGAGRFFLATAGQATKITAYCRGRYEEGLALCKIYDDNGNILIESSIITLSNTFSWHEFLFPSPIDLQTGYYYLMLHANVFMQLQYDTGGENVTLHGLEVEGRTFPFNYTNFKETPYAEYGNNLLSIYATYTSLQLSVEVTPNSANLQVGQSQIFQALTSGGTPPYQVNWVDNITKQIIGVGETLTFNASEVGNFEIYSEATDSLASVVNSLIVPIVVIEASPMHVLTVDSVPIQNIPFTIERI